ncbi:MAG: universal stress protein [Verrucomicrobiota bacterium]
MKIKPADKPGSVVVEVGPKDSQLLAPESAANQPPLPLIHLRKILVPIDFSDCSKQALKYAIAFAKQFRAAVTLLTVAPVFYTFSEFGLVDVPGLEKEREQQCQEQLKKLADQELHNEVPIQTAVRSGQPFQEIVEAAKDLEMDLIIIATHGHTGLTHVLLGSTAERVIRYAPCPVLVVQPKEHEFVTS